MADAIGSVKRFVRKEWKLATPTVPVEVEKMIHWARSVASEDGVSIDCADWCQIVVGDDEVILYYDICEDT